MKMLRLLALLALVASPAAAQWQTPNHSVPVGKGAGYQGFGSAAPGTAGLPLTSNGASSDPSFQVLPNAGLAPMATNTTKCNPTGGSATPQDCTVTQLLTMLAGTRSVTTNDVATAADCNKVIIATGGFKTLTLPAASAVQAGCVIGYRNDEVYSGIGTGRGKKISGAPTDFTPDSRSILYPNQAGAVVSDGTNWKSLVKPGRWILPAGAELCMRQDGDDTSDGLGNGTVAADCLATIQTAVNTIGKAWDGGGYNACNIGVYAGGTSTLATATQTGQSVGCYLTINLYDNVTWSATGPCYSTGDNAIIIFNVSTGKTLTLQCNTSNAASSGAFYGHQTVIMDINGPGTYKWISGGSADNFLFMDAQGRAALNAPFTLGDGSVRSGNTFITCDAHCAGVVVAGNITTATSMTLSRMYALYGGSWMNLGATYTTTGTVSNASLVSGNSTLITNGATPPTGTTTAGTGGAGMVCATKC